MPSSFSGAGYKESRFRFFRLFKRTKKRGSAAKKGGKIFVLKKRRNLRVRLCYGSGHHRRMFFFAIKHWSGIPGIPDGITEPQIFFCKKLCRFRAKSLFVTLNLFCRIKSRPVRCLPTELKRELGLNYFFSYTSTSIWLTGDVWSIMCRSLLSIFL